MTKTSEWPYSQRRIVKSTHNILINPSEGRIEDRISVQKIIVMKDVPSTEKIDLIINYFRNKYEGEKWTGLGRKARRELFIQEKGICRWCKKMLTIKTFTVDHLLTRQEGGQDEWTNYGIACNTCNSGREGDLLNKLGQIKMPTQRDQIY